ncbi:transposase, partial [Escherichia coli]|nr:transposase [Escherichia coli]
MVIHPHFVLVYEVDSQWGKVYILRVIYYEKRGNAENYIKEAKYDMAVGHLLLKSFWANEAVFQMMMLSYNLFLLF